MSMAAGLLSREVSDICIGKPALKPLPISATVGEAVFALKSYSETYVSIIDKSPDDFIGKICMVDILCYLCNGVNISNPLAALDKPVSTLLSKEGIRHVEANSRILDAVDMILDMRTHSLIVDIVRKEEVLYCWLTQEDLVRYFLNSISAFSSIASLSVTSLGLVDPAVLSIPYHKPAITTLALIRSAVVDTTAVAVVTNDGKLVGEISPATLSACDETVAAAIASLSASELMTYIDCCSGGAESSVLAVKARLKKKGMQGMLQLMEEESTFFLSSSSSGSSASSTSSSDDESLETFYRKRRPRKTRGGSYSARMGRRSEEAIVCHPESSLVSVMVQALAHRVSYVWVVDDDYGLVGIVTFQDVLRVLREQVPRTRGGGQF